MLFQLRNWFSVGSSLLLFAFRHGFMLGGCSGVNEDDPASVYQTPKTKWRAAITCGARETEKCENKFPYSKFALERKSESVMSIFFRTTT